MAKEIIDKVKKAESEAAELIKKAGMDADGIITDAEKKAKELYDAGIKKAKAQAGDRILGAEKKAEGFIKEAIDKAEGEKEEIKAQAASKQKDAEDMIIRTLLD